MSVFWYQVYQAQLWERMLNRSASLAMSTSILKALPGKLDIKRHSPSTLYVYNTTATFVIYTTYMPHPNYMLHSCINTYAHSCFKPFSNQTKAMFKSWNSRAVWTWVWTWKYLKWALHHLHDVIMESVEDQTDHFADVFVRENVTCGYDVMTFESTQPTPFCLEKSSVRKWTI